MTKSKKGGEKGREVKIGPCLSKGGAARGASTPARRLSLQRHSGSLSSSGLDREPSDQSDNGGGKMKGLFKSKPRTPADIVRQTRDLLLYADRSKSLPDLRESKREEKVSPLLQITMSVCSLSVWICLLNVVVAFLFVDGGAKQEHPWYEVYSLWKQRGRACGWSLCSIDSRVL